MRVFGLILLTCLMVGVVVSQETVATPPAVEDSEIVVVTDREALTAAVAVKKPEDRIGKIIDFMANYPESDLRVEALESLAGARALYAESKLLGGEIEESVTLFRLAVAESPEPVSDDLFSKLFVNIPAVLFMNNQRDAAFDVADMLELKAAQNSRQLLRLATFHISVKYATGARRLAQKSIALNPEDPIAYQTLGTTERLGFNLEGAADAYAEGLKYNPDSIQLKQNLADMRRALGQPILAESLYRQVLDSEPENVAAKTGVILSLFEQNKRKEAEAILIPELSANATNGFAMLGAAYWYVSNGEPELAVDYANQARILEKSAVWSYIILARAYTKLDRPSEAERMLVAARQFGDSATISFELALAQKKAGFYYDAATELKRKFYLENGKIVTELDGRIGAEADDFAQLVSLERKSILFAPQESYSRDEIEQLKALFLFEGKFGVETTTDEELDLAAKRFIGQNDAEVTYRRLYVAKRLLDQNKLPERASEIVNAAVDTVDQSADSKFSSSAVMADQLFEGRKAAAATGRTVEIPAIERTTIAKILRGRIEELTGRSLVIKDDLPEAELRFRRAVSVLPEKSAWWRSSMWRLGEVYERRGEDKKALESYVASYRGDNPDPERAIALQSVYLKVNGNLDGFEDMLIKTPDTQKPSSNLFLKESPTVASATTKESEDADVSSSVSAVTEAAPKIDENVDLRTPQNTGISFKPVLVITDPTANSVRNITSFDPRAANISSTNRTGTVNRESSVSNEITSRTATPLIIKPVVSKAVEAVPKEVAEKPPIADIQSSDKALSESITQKELEIQDAPAIVVKNTEAELPSVKLLPIDSSPPPAKPTLENTAKSTQAVKGELINDAEPPANTEIEKSVVKSEKTIPEAELPTVRDPATPLLDDAPILKTAPAELSTEIENPDSNKGAIEVKLDETGPRSDSRTISPPTTAELIDLGATRPRIVSKEKVRTDAEESTACRLVFSQERVSIFKNGGSFGIVVGLKNYSQPYVMRARSDSPENVSITYEPDIGSVDGRAFFIIKSVSENTGEYTVTFETPCGSEKIVVDVK